MTSQTTTDTFGINRKATKRVAREIERLPVYHALNALGAYKAFRNGDIKRRPLIHDNAGRVIAPVCAATSYHLMVKIGLENLNEVTPFVPPSQRRRIERHRREAERRVEVELAKREIETTTVVDAPPVLVEFADDDAAFIHALEQALTVAPPQFSSPRPNAANDDEDFARQQYGGIDVYTKPFDRGQRVVVVVFLEGVDGSKKTRRVYNLMDNGVTRQKSGGALNLSVEKMRETEWKAGKLLGFPSVMNAVADDL